MFVCLFFFETRAYYVALDDLELVMQTRGGPQTHQNSLSLPPENCNLEHVLLVTHHVSPGQHLLINSFYDGLFCEEHNHDLK